MDITRTHVSILRKVQDGHVGWEPNPKARGFTRRMSSGIQRRYQPTGEHLHELIALWQLKFGGFIAPAKADVPGPVVLTGLGVAELHGSEPSDDRRSA
ncbi:hypothetical protein [Actinophytocola sp.]|uniref:hypothetical protein n=1 Tax=Actinophytocola sp. TaxID=1872138 RepID=UPI002D4B5B7B|nr:hypothetical protein [Actinophytocola sp.]HYQ69098.1 hypothetical protein [Actinophytocola sp.]